MEKFDLFESKPNIGDKRALELLILALKYALKDKNKDVRISAAEALGDIGDKRALEPLILAIRDVDWNVRSHAAEALGKIGEPAIEPLIQALKNANSIVRRRAQHQLLD